MKCRCLLLCLLLLLCLESCKKENTAPSNNSLILGKWLLSKSVSQLYNSSKQLLSSTTSTTFTADDFVEYYDDGSGYYSESTPAGTSLSDFTYTISGTALTEFTGPENNSMPETITSITVTALGIHAVSLVPDPNDPEVTDTEIDDYS